MFLLTIIGQLHFLLFPPFFFSTFSHVCQIYLAEILIIHFILQLLPSKVFITIWLPKWGHFLWRGVHLVSGSSPITVSLSSLWWGGCSGSGPISVSPELIVVGGSTLRFMWSHLYLFGLRQLSAGHDRMGSFPSDGQSAKKGDQPTKWHLYWFRKTGMQISFDI